MTTGFCLLRVQKHPILLTMTGFCPLRVQNHRFLLTAPRPRRRPCSAVKLFFRTVPEKPISPLRTSFVTQRPPPSSPSPFLGRGCTRSDFKCRTSCGFCLLWPIYAQGPLDEIRPCAKPPHFAHGPAAATLLRGGNNFSGRCRKNQFPRSAPPSSPSARRLSLFLRQPTPAAFSTAPALLPISSVNCKTLKYNLLRKRGVSVFDTPLLSNPLKISTLYFTPSVPS